ncbi:MAG: hypothetical protein KGJ13_12905, partial [Patescibacteria group bacterium]|nr:hypothetical protein [Patescibacteria group bacterium]
YVDRVRRQMRPLYAFFDKIVQHRAWNEDFYKTIQEEFPDYRGIPYKDAFYQWQNSFTALWPNLLTEPDSEKTKTDKVRLDAILEAIEIIGPMLDPENKATLIEWAQDSINQNKLLFQSPLAIDIDALAEYEPPIMGMGEEAGPGEPKPPKPGFSRGDSAGRSRKARKMTEDELGDLVTMMENHVTTKANGKMNGHAGHA